MVDNVDPSTKEKTNALALAGKTAHDIIDIITNNKQLVHEPLREDAIRKMIESSERMIGEQNNPSGCKQTF